MGSKLTEKMTGTANKVGFAMKKHSPELLIVTGIVGVVASAVVACKKTMKLPEIIENHQRSIDDIFDEFENNEEMTKKEYQKKAAKVYLKTSVSIAGLYAPALSLGTASIGCILASNNILRKRNVALAAAYSAIDKGFKEYRARVVERFGEEVDHQLLYNLKSEEIEETVTDEKGKEKKVKKQVLTSDGKESMYAKYFASGNNEWINDPSFFKDWLSMKQRFANERLKAVGHLTLNEVYRELGFHDTKPGMVVGWLYDKKNPTGDNYVELSAKEVYIPNENTGIRERAYLIDFNVDGNIYELMN